MNFTTTTAPTTAYVVEVDLSAGVRAEYLFETVFEAVTVGENWVRDAIRTTLDGDFSEVVVLDRVFRIEAANGRTRLFSYRLGNYEGRREIFSPESF